jgi:hypothetical protein
LQNHQFLMCSCLFMFNYYFFFFFKLCSNPRLKPSLKFLQSDLVYKILMMW